MNTNHHPPTKKGAALQPKTYRINKPKLLWLQQRHNSSIHPPEAFGYTLLRNKSTLFPCFRFLSVKKWLLRKKHQIELARKRGWKGYWVCLKGTTLLFYPCDSREGRSVEAAPKHLIIVDGAIMQPIPEHPKRDYIFCLSTAFGDAYLFQAPCQVSDIELLHFREIFAPI